MDIDWYKTSFHEQQTAITQSTGHRLSKKGNKDISDPLSLFPFCGYSTSFKVKIKGLEEFLIIISTCQTKSCLNIIWTSQLGVEEKKQLRETKIISFTFCLASLPNVGTGEADNYS